MAWKEELGRCRQSLEPKSPPPSPSSLAAAVRCAALHLTPFYTLAGSSGSVPNWREVCHSDVCDAYSAGNGNCLMQASDPWALDQSLSRRLSEGDAERQRLRKGPQQVLVTSNCKTRRLWPGDAAGGASGGASGVEIPVLHCPKEAPLAILVLPKCGTTSAANWALLMEGHLEADSLWRAGQLVLRRGHHRLNPLVKDWLYPELVKAHFAGANISDGSTSVFIARLLHRVRLEVVPTQQYQPPAHLCPMCCAYGRGRQLVVVARNPYVRLASAFRYGWLNDRTGLRARWRWRHFEAWLETMFAYHREGAAESWAQLGKQSADPASWFHLRPLGDIASDVRFLAGREVFERGDHFVLHLEALSEDLGRLSGLLCQRFSFCGGLPDFPDVVLPSGNVLEHRQLRERCELEPLTLRWSNCTAPPWLELWTNRTVALVARHYASDFAWLGYAQDPGRLAPLALAFAGSTAEN